MKSFKNFLVEKNNPNNPSEENPQISKSDAKKIRKMKDADPDTAKKIQAGLESSREAARRIKSGETRTSQTGQKTRTKPSSRNPDLVGDQPDDPSRKAQAQQSGRVRTGTNTPRKDLPQADTAKVTPEKAAERDRFMSSRRGRPAGQGEVERAAAMNQAKADGADKPFKTPRGRGAAILDRLTGRATRKRSSAIPSDAFGKPSGTDPKTGKAMYVPPKDIPQRKQRVDPKTGKATQAGVRNFAMSQGGYARSGRNMPKPEFDKIQAKADKIANDPTSKEYKRIEKKINQEYGGRRARRRPSNAPSFSQVKAQIDAKNPVRQTPVGPVPATQSQPQQQPQQKQPPRKSFNSFKADLDLGTVKSPIKSMPAKGAPLEVGKGGGASTGSKPTTTVKNPIPKVSTPKPTPTPTQTKPTTTIPKVAKDLLGPNPKPTTVSMPDTPKPAPFKNPVSGFVKGALKRGKSVKPGSPLSMAAQLAAGEVLDRGVQRLQTPMSRSVTRGIASLTGTTDKMKKLQPSAYDMAGPDLTPEIIRRLKPKELPLPGKDPATTPKPNTETEGEFEINRRGRKVTVKKNTDSIDPKANPEAKPKTTTTQTQPQTQTKTPKVKQKEKELNKQNRPLKMPPIPGGPGYYTKIETTKSPWRPVKPK
tara:strand:+ start:1127 stop:3067 length:1941 start_codon:yes stop_codon:yes gene_type:complete